MEAGIEQWQFDAGAHTLDPHFTPLATCKEVRARKNEII